ncbi:MAG: serine/threonine-protein kinase HipA [Oleiphilaceae bacterium]|jgi:serine/threonine-protein kinase HipA
MTRTLNVFIDKTLVGKLTDDNNIWSFEYASTWLTSAKSFPISPSIPLNTGKQTDGSSSRPIQWFFDNLLPEEKARELLAKDIKEPVEDVFALLTKAGAESAGAITLLPPDTPIPEGDIHPLTKEEVNKRIELLPKTSLNRGERKRMSLAGAQHKMLVVLHEGELYEPSGNMPSTHILKPCHSDPEMYYQTPINEWFVMKLADKCGLNVPPVDIVYFPEPAYIIERFDRKGHHPHQKRLHMLDGCQLLNYPHLTKYRNNNVESLVSIVNKTRTKAKTLLEIYRWACFNAMVGNGDAHLKNLSFFISKDHITMTPHYDLLSTAIYEGIGKHLEHELAQEMGGVKILADLKRAHVLTFGMALGLREKLAESTLDDVIKKIVPHSTSMMMKAQKERNLGEVRTIREIHYNCIIEMSGRLA